MYRDYSPYELQQQRYILPLSLAYLYIFFHISLYSKASPPSLVSL